MRRNFVEDLGKHDQAARIAALRRPLLVLHSPTDDTVDISNATGIFVAAKHPKSFVSLDDADHLLSRPQDAEYGASGSSSSTRFFTREVSGGFRSEKRPNTRVCAVLGCSFYGWSVSIVCAWDSAAAKATTACPIVPVKRRSIPIQVASRSIVSPLW